MTKSRVLQATLRSISAPLGTAVATAWLVCNQAFAQDGAAAPGASGAASPPVAAPPAAVPPTVVPPPADVPPVPAVVPPADVPAVPSMAAPPVAAPPGASQAVQTVASGQLPHDLSPWSMFVHADIVVQAVMVGLAFASVVTWTVWLAKSIEIASAKRRAHHARKVLAKVRSIEEARQQLQARHGVGRHLLESAVTELRMSADAFDKEGIKERVASRLERIEAASGRKITRGTSALATIGSTAPFVGLFGTVWGIMNSFIGISKAHTTSLAVVAPGIAEALLATAIGLVAAIPAVMIYNVFARTITTYRAELGDISAEVLRLVSRDLDRHTASQSPKAARPFPAAAE